MSAVQTAVAGRPGCTWGPESATHELIRYAEQPETAPTLVREVTHYGCDVHTAQHMGGPLDGYDEVLPLGVAS